MKRPSSSIHSGGCRTRSMRHWNQLPSSGVDVSFVLLALKTYFESILRVKTEQLSSRSSKKCVGSQGAMWQLMFELLKLAKSSNEDWLSCWDEFLVAIALQIASWWLQLTVQGVLRVLRPIGVIVLIVSLSQIGFNSFHKAICWLLAAAADAAAATD